MNTGQVHAANEMAKELINMYSEDNSRIIPLIFDYVSCHSDNIPYVIVNSYGLPISYGRLEGQFVNPIVAQSYNATLFPVEELDQAVLLANNTFDGSGRCGTVKRHLDVLKENLESNYEQLDWLEQFI